MLTRQIAMRNLLTLLALGALAGCGMRSTLADSDQALVSDESAIEDADDKLAPCGNGVAPCDSEDLGGASCQTLGMGTGVLACDPVMCLYDTSMCDSNVGGGVGGVNDMGGTGPVGGGTGTAGMQPAPGGQQAIFGGLFGGQPTAGEQGTGGQQAIFGGLFGGQPTAGEQGTGGQQAIFGGLFGGQPTAGEQGTGGQQAIFGGLFGGQPTAGDDAAEQIRQGIFGGFFGGQPAPEDSDDPADPEDVTDEDLE